MVLSLQHRRQLPDGLGVLGQEVAHTEQPHLHVSQSFGEPGLQTGQHPLHALHHLLVDLSGHDVQFLFRLNIGGAFEAGVLLSPAVLQLVPSFIPELLLLQDVFLEEEGFEFSILLIAEEVQLVLGDLKANLAGQRPGQDSRHGWLPFFQLNLEPEDIVVFNMLNEQRVRVLVTLVDSHPFVVLPQVHSHSFRRVLAEQDPLLREAKPAQGRLGFDWHRRYSLQFAGLKGDLVGLHLKDAAGVEGDGGVVGDKELVLEGSHGQECPVKADGVDLVARVVEYLDLGLAGDSSPVAAKKHPFDFLPPVVPSIHDPALEMRHIYFPFEIGMAPARVHETVVSQSIVKQSFGGGFELDFPELELVMVLKFEQGLVAIGSLNHTPDVVVEHEPIFEVARIRRLDGRLRVVRDN